ncbi:MAG: Nif11-like leader peptide family natural product precursor [Deltaproteobacteria bacterium]|nr:Nif11-like leader peptide family natural product precursor [Deltaproteobacteria bacterium]
MKGVTEFLHQVQHDPGFIEQAQACASDAERLSFLRKEGFEFAPEELEAAMSSFAFLNTLTHFRETKDLRKTQRYDVFLKVTELNGQPMNEAAILDISAWGAKIESMVSLLPDSPVELSFSLPGAEKETQVRLVGKVVWAGQMPVSKRNQAGLIFYNSLDQLNRAGNFPLEKVKSAIQKQREEITQNEFLSVKEFAGKIGVHWFTVWRWTVEKRIHFKQVKSGCKILIPTSELLQFQESSGQSQHTEASISIL